MTRPLCVICRWRPVWAKDRCQTCLRYFYRHGEDRPEKLVVEHGRRTLEGRIRRHTLETRARISASKTKAG